MKSEPTTPTPVQIVIEQEGAQKYKIQSDQLEHIGTQLRGKRQFSVFNSIILPVIVTILTTLFTGLFQYISWTNSVRLQNATDNAEKASETYENAAAAISKRRYATWLFIPAVRDLANAGRKPQMADATAATTGTIPKMEAPPAKGDPEISLSALQLQLVKQRYESYYGQLKIWNESYDQLLTDIDYNLDRPILLQAELRSEAVRVFAAKFKQMDCTQSLIGQLDKLGLNKHSLKVQFAAIQACFMRVHGVLNEMIQAAPRVSTDLVDKANADLGHVYTMSNEFRCYAQRRIDYYRRQKRLEILSPQLVWRQFFNTAKSDAERHFARTAERCNPENRPA